MNRSEKRAQCATLIKASSCSIATTTHTLLLMIISSQIAVDSIVVVPGRKGVNRRHVTELVVVQEVVVFPSSKDQRTV